MTISFQEACAAVCAPGTRFEIQEIDVLGVPTTLGIVKGDRVAIAMRNSPEWIAAFAAITSVGAIAVPMNAWWQTDEMVFALADSGARIVFADADRLARLHAAEPGSVSVQVLTVRDDPTPTGLVLAVDGLDVIPLDDFLVPDATLPDVDIDPDPDRPQAAVMLCVPLFHVTGLVPVMLGAFVGGSKLVMTYKWDPDRALELIEQERVTSFVGVPTMSWDMLEAATFAERDTSSLRAVGGGGAPMPPELVKRIDDNFRRGRPSLGYGMTETNACRPR